MNELTTMDQNIIRHVPEKYRKHIMDAYRDEDGIWVEFDEHVGNTMEGSDEYATIHVDTVKQLKDEADCLILH